jgi:hypothetical protein
MLAVVGVFIEIPWVSNFAFWVAIAAKIAKRSKKMPAAWRSSS